mmetsp:Transcript_106726/g.307007  ORF Transcript_106726/g.307007 Transcript_106726/m.307007 type:complete len:274 (+) Transcript_106726:220-1041(+)
MTLRGIPCAAMCPTPPRFHWPNKRNRLALQLNISRISTRSPLFLRRRSLCWMTSMRRCMRSPHWKGINAENRHAWDRSWMCRFAKSQIQRSTECTPSATKLRRSGCSRRCQIAHKPCWKTWLVQWISCRLDSSRPPMSHAGRRNGRSTLPTPRRHSRNQTEFPKHPSFAPSRNGSRPQAMRLPARLRARHQAMLFASKGPFKLDKPSCENCVMTTRCVSRGVSSCRWRCSACTARSESSTQGLATNALGCTRPCAASSIVPCSPRMREPGALP